MSTILFREIRIRKHFSFFDIWRSFQMPKFHNTMQEKQRGRIPLRYKIDNSGDRTNFQATGQIFRRQEIISSIYMCALVRERPQNTTNLEELSWRKLIKTKIPEM